MVLTAARSVLIGTVSLRAMKHGIQHDTLLSRTCAALRVHVWIRITA
jgi:hypothetical protein